MALKNPGELLKHLEKQNELLEDAHKKMAFELHRLQVEESMLMNKFMDLTSALGLDKKTEVRSLESINREDEDHDAGANNTTEG